MPYAELRQLNVPTIERVSVAELATLCERFTWMVEQAAARGPHYTLAELERFLNLPPTRPAHYERLLVLLFLHADPRAATLIARFEPPAHDLKLIAFHHVVLAYMARREGALIEQSEAA